MTIAIIEGKKQERDDLRQKPSGHAFSFSPVKAAEPTDASVSAPAA